MSAELFTIGSMAITFGITLGISLLLTRKELQGLLDHPNDRSLHTSPTPRTGGLAILAGLLSGGLFYAGTVSADMFLPAVLATCAIAIIVISLLDDLRQMPAFVRVIVHVGAAYCLLSNASLTSQSLVLPWVSFPMSGWPAGLFSVLLLVWFTNLYNFMDGIDGLATGMGIFGFSSCALLGILASAPVFSVISALIACSCLGFLRVNFPPARIFMGDVGSSVLGFLAAGIILWADRYNIFPLWVGVLIFSPFVVDATITLLRRLLNREAFWRAHRSHFYQRLILQGWTHRRTSLNAYALMTACGLSAIVAMKTSSSVQIGIIICWALIYLLLIIGITRMERFFQDSRAANETGTIA